MSENAEGGGEGKLTVEVFSPKGVLWEGVAQAVSSANSQGPFDLLPEHAHFVSLVTKQPIHIVTESEIKTFTFDTAVIRLLDDKVTIFAEIS